MLPVPKDIDLKMSPSISKMGVLTGIFWTSNAILQRASGLIRIHAGRFYPVTVAWGFTCTCASIILAQYNTDGIVDRLSDAIPALISSSSSQQWLQKVWRNGNNSKENAKQFALTIGIYALLERRLFRSFMPSSLLATGAYAPSITHITSHSVDATSPIATPSQRYAVQKLGNIHGCHHCGSRQLLTSQSFIADHMPPTKNVLIANERWYRRIFGSWGEMSQKLLPQCYACFQQQGGAVRAGVHQIIYHSPIRVWHFSPAIAYGLLEKKLLQDTWVMDALNSLSNNATVIATADTVQNLVKLV